MNLHDTMNHYVSKLTPTVTYAPTLSGGTGSRALRRFYDQYFLEKLPPSMHLRLISRTSGADRIADELYVSFEHTQEIPWMLPGVPPTNRRVEIVMVSIVSLRAKQLYSEHIYWDQASVLVQVGLLDPKLVPQGFQGVDRLPVIGREAARRMLNEDPEVDEPEYHNRMIKRAKHKNEGKSGVNSPAVQSEVEGPSKGKKAGGGQNPNKQSSLQTHEEHETSTEQTNTEQSRKEQSHNEQSQNKQSNNAPSNNAPSNDEPSNNEPSRNEQSHNEQSRNERSRNEKSQNEQTAGNEGNEKHDEKSQH